MQLNNPNLFLEQILTQLNDGREYSQLPIQEDKSCILVALENKEYEAADYLMTKLALTIEPAVIDKENWLSFTTHYKSPALDEKIISLGADVRHVTDSNKLEPIVYAILDNNHSLLNRIVEKNKTFSQDELDNYFHLACQRGAFNCLAILKQEGANIDAVGITGNTPLLSAIENGQEITATRLIDLKANVHAKNINDVTPLILATSKQFKSIVIELLNEEADVNYMPYLGDSALMIASRFGDKEIIKELFKKKPDTELKNHNDQTAMDIAIELNQKESIQLLQENGAKCNNFSYIVKSNIDSIREKVFGGKNHHNSID
jgi:ankyrin repeat protein